MTSTSARVSGHTLRNEGAPFLTAENGQVVRAGNVWGGISGLGRGLCSCGETSGLLDSSHKRKAWHREHKAEITALLAKDAPAEEGK